MKILIDSREQDPFSFSRFDDVEVVRGCLPSGDYALPGELSTRCAIERKSIPDLVQSISSERDRFFSELRRLRSYDAALLLVEGPFRQIAEGRYRSRMHPKAATETIFSIMAAFRMPVMFCENKVNAEEVCYSFLRHYARNFLRQFKTAAEALGDVK